jgi:hypothetical protein
MTGPTRQKPNKVLSGRVVASLGLESWPDADFPGDPYWQGGATPKPYRWQLTVNINQQQHGDPSTREPYQYNGYDVDVGNWIADVDRGRSLKIINVLNKSVTQVTIVVEDVVRYNTFLDPFGNGLFPVPSNIVTFSINNMLMPILNPLPTDFTDVTFSQEVMGRFTNNNPLYRTRVYQPDHGLSDNQTIWVDPVDGLFKLVMDDDQLKRMVGTVDQAGPGPDTFYFVPTTKIVEGIDPPLPGTAGSLIYVDPFTGELTADPTDKTKVAYIQLTNATPDSTSSSLNTVVQNSILAINDVDVTFTGSTMQSVVDDVNLLSGSSNVTATLNAGINSATTNPGQLSYGLCACLGTNTIATINGVTVNFNNATNGTIEFGSPVVNAVDMANSINAAGIPNITAVGNGSLSLTINHAAGGAISIVNVNNDDSNIPFAGNNSCSGVPLSTSAGGIDFIEFTNALGNGIIFQNVLGTPVFDLGLTSVRNGMLPTGLVVEQYVTSGGVVVYPDLGSLPVTGQVGEQAFVIDSDNGSGSNVNEWTMYLWDGFGWVETSNEDSAGTDARSFEVLVDFDSVSPVTVGKLSNGRRVISVVVDVLTIFNGTPTLNIGDAGDPARLMSDAYLDLSTNSSFSVTTDFVYETGQDVTVLATYTPGGATVGQAKVIITYV